MQSRDAVVALLGTLSTVELGTVGVVRHHDAVLAGTSWQLLRRPILTTDQPMDTGSGPDDADSTATTYGSTGGECLHPRHLRLHESTVGRNGDSSIPL